MAWSSEHKKNTRYKIVHAAAHLFTTYGFDQVGINDVMKEAGLTRGAFYAHFKSKSELYAESILTAAKLAKNKLGEHLPKHDAKATLVKRYLSEDHRSVNNEHCPLAFLATDISQRDEEVRSTYTKVFKGFLDNFEKGTSNPNREKTMQSAVLMIGGLAIARAVNDDKLVKELFAACQKGVIEQ